MQKTVLAFKICRPECGIVISSKKKNWWRTHCRFDWWSFRRERNPAERKEYLYLAGSVFQCKAHHWVIHGLDAHLTATRRCYDFKWSELLCVKDGNVPSKHMQCVNELQNENIGHKSAKRSWFQLSFIPPERLTCNTPRTLSLQLISLEAVIMLRTCDCSTDMQFVCCLVRINIYYVVNCL